MHASRNLGHRYDFPADAYGLRRRSCRKLYLRTNTREERTRPTDEPAYPVTDPRHRGHAGAGEPRWLALRAKPHQRDQRGPGQSGRIRRRHRERSERENSGHRAASLRPRPRPRPRHARQGGMLGVPVGCARRISAVHGHPDHRSRRQPVLRLAPDQPRARSERSCLFQAGEGLAGCRRGGAGVRSPDRNIGASDRLSRAIGCGRAEIRAARFVQPEQIRGISR